MAKSVHQRQLDYVSSLNASNFKYGLTVGAAFVKGVRDIGYKHSGTALDELIDNSWEAGASNVHVALHDDGSGRKNNVTHIAVIDNGSGMIPEMIRAAMLWGGTDRWNSRTGIGRYGYGLPSASVSLGRRFEVYSQIEGGQMHVCELDLDDIEAGKYTSKGGEIVVPEVQSGKLPAFVQKYIAEHLPEGFTKGTVVVITKLDRLDRKSALPLQNALLEHFGVVYHKLRGNFDIAVNGRRVDPIDPLFLTPGFRWYDLDADRATALDMTVIDAKDKETKQVIGQIRVRYSYMPTRFGSIDKRKKAAGKNANERFKVLREHNGFIFARMGRVIEVVRHSPLTTFMNNDTYLKVEVDFDASLDEYFNVPTSKQRVDLDDAVWGWLAENGVMKAVEQMRRYISADLAAQRAKEDALTPEQKRPSEDAMEATKKFAPVIPAPVKEKREERARERLAQEVDKRAAETGKPKEEARLEIEAELGGKPYKVALRSIPGGAFFEVDQLGGTKVLWLNTASRFFKEVHSGEKSTPAVRAALEILLFSIGDRILEGQDELRAFYAHEVPEWSKKLEVALAHLAQNLTSIGPDDEQEPDAPAEPLAA
jgi:hypothetical protein